MAKQNKFVGLIIIVVIGLVITGLSISKNNDEKPITNQPKADIVESVTPPPVDNNDSVSSDSYKDGTYTSNGEYYSPGGTESLDVTITIKDGKITSSSVAPQAASRESMEYQDDFVNNYDKQVKGKDIATLKLGKIAGSSLTPYGFNNAIEKIRNQAKG